MTLSDIVISTGLSALYLGIFAGEQGVVVLVIWGIAMLIFISI